MYVCKDDAASCRKIKYVCTEEVKFKGCLKKENFSGLILINGVLRAKFVLCFCFFFTFALKYLFRKRLDQM